jgi:hypothetical protein
MNLSTLEMQVVILNGDRLLRALLKKKMTILERMDT